MGTSAIYDRYSEFKEFFLEQAFVMDLSLEGRVNRLAMTCLQPLHYIQPGARLFSINDQNYVTEKKAERPMMNHSWAYLIVCQATILALALKVFNYLINAKCRAHLQAFRKHTLTRPFPAIPQNIEDMWKSCLRNRSSVYSGKETIGKSLTSTRIDISAKAFQSEIDRAPSTDGKDLLSNLTNFATRFFTSLEGAKKENLKKNRYTDIVPYDYTIARTGRVGDGGYINANHVYGADGTHYISAQGPTKHTAVDHFRMILHEKATVQVRLTEAVEKGVNKCYPYWDTKSVQLNDQTYVRRKVDSEQRKRFEFFNTASNELLHTCQQIDFEDWGDHGTPDLETFVALLNRMDRILDAPQYRGPLLVHCSAGVGRSGTFMACLSLAREMRHKLLQGGDQQLNITEAIIKMRCQRKGLVQGREQEIFIYRVLKHKLESLLQESHPFIQPKW